MTLMINVETGTVYVNGVTLKLPDVAIYINQRLPAGWQTARSISAAYSDGPDGGQLHFPPQLLAMAEADIVGSEPYAAGFAVAVKNELKRRLAITTKNEVTQMNIVAYWADLATRPAKSLGEAEKADLDMARTLRAWTMAMVETSRTLIAAKSPYRGPNIWPEPPEGGRAFADRF